MRIFAFLFCIFSITANAQNQESKIQRDDILKLTGSDWEGTLTYRDYGNDKFVTIKSGLKVERPAENLFLFFISYPDEPEMNSVDSVWINKSGTMLGDENVIRRKMKGDTVIVVTEKKVIQDEGSSMNYRYTYKMHPKYFLITKIEKADGSEDFKERNRYLFKRD